MPGQVDIPTVSDLSVEEKYEVVSKSYKSHTTSRHEGLVIHGALTEFSTGFGTMFLLILDQQPGNDLDNMFKAHVNVSSAVLKAAAHHYGSQCDKPNKEFMLCRWEEKDPRKCLEEGRRVNECALNFFRQIKGNCSESFTEYWTCLDYSGLAELRHCRKQQKVFDDCVLEKLGWERPELGDLSKVTKVATSRPLPENPYHSRPRPEPNPVIDAPLEPAKHGSRLFFWNW